LNILAIDVGLANVGFAIFNCDSSQATYIKSGSFHTKNNKPVEKRLADIYTFFNHLIEDNTINTLAVERPVFQGKHLNHDVVKSEAIFMILAGLNNLSYYPYSSTEVKKTLTGDGKADKQQVESGVFKYLNKTYDFKNDHESDAVAIGITFYKLTQN